MTLDERETIIRWDDGEKVAWLYTCSPVVERKWRKKGYLLAKDGHGWRTRIPAKLIRFGKPQSESQRAASAERMRDGMRRKAAAFNPADV